MDRITSRMLAEFTESYSLGSLSESTAFEHFCAHLVLNEHYSETFSTLDVVVGNGGDGGVDAVGVIANGVLVLDPEEITDIVETNGYLDVTFVFVQSETSESFSMQKLGNFGFGVADFFKEAPSLPLNDDMRSKHSISNKVFDSSSRFSKGNPKCLLYYVTCGTYKEDDNSRARIQAVKGDLDILNLFREVKINMLGASEIHELFRRAGSAESREVSLPNKAALPELPGVKEAYIGYISGSEYLKLIRNSEGEIIGSLFYDNVRHWQLWNPVNSEIKKTLEDDSQRILFPLLNNGVTIVAQNITSTGNKLLLEDYQIVNGCQTSHVLHEVGDKVDENLHIPVRIISTTEQEIRNSIIKATNRQTTVSDEQLIALSDFPKKLEDFFVSYDTSHPLYFERRSKQYESVAGIEKVRIISITNLIRSFASMFLALPHQTTRGYKNLLSLLGTDIMKDDHRLEMYFLSAYAYYRLEYLYRSQAIDSKLKTARFQILLAFRLIADSGNLPAPNSRDMSKRCKPMIETLLHDEKYKTVFNKAVTVVDELLEGNYYRDAFHTQVFTKKIISKIEGN